MAIPGYAAKLPLTIHLDEGPYTLIKTLKETVAQNLKMLCLTAPGGRLMNPDYGIGLRKFIFEQNSAMAKTQIKTKINSQIEKYMSFIDIEDIMIANDREDDNAIRIKIVYNAGPLITSEHIELVLNSNASQGSN